MVNETDEQYQSSQVREMLCRTTKKLGFWEDILLLEYVSAHIHLFAEYRNSKLLCHEHEVLLKQMTFYLLSLINDREIPTRTVCTPHGKTQQIQRLSELEYKRQCLCSNIF